jgi:hypothetical protein
MMPRIHRMVPSSRDQDHGAFPVKPARATVPARGPLY